MRPQGFPPNRPPFPTRHLLVGGGRVPGTPPLTRQVLKLYGKWG